MIDENKLVGHDKLHKNDKPRYKILIYFPILSFIFAFLLPVMVPVYGWNETWSRAFMSLIIRYVFGLNCIWSVNSVAHIWGSKPYDASINPTENEYVAFATFGEGWHNYHHVFPWDYKAAELGNYSLNFTTMFIDFCAKIGWAYNLKQPSKALIRNVVTKRVCVDKIRIHSQECSLLSETRSE